MYLVLQKANDLMCHIFLKHVSNIVRELPDHKKKKQDDIRFLNHHLRFGTEAVDILQLKLYYLHQVRICLLHLPQLYYFLFKTFS